MRTLLWTAGGLLLVAVLLGPAAAPAQAQPIVVTESPAVTYSYYAPPVYAPAPVTTTYYRSGLFGRRSVAVTNYGVAAPVVSYYGTPAVTTYYGAPAVTTYYGAPSVTTYYAPRRVVTYYGDTVYCPW